MKPVKRKKHLLRRRFRSLKRTHRGLNALENAREKRVRKLLHQKKAVLRKQQKQKQQNKKQKDKQMCMEMKQKPVSAGDKNHERKHQRMLKKISRKKRAQARRETAKLNRTLRRRRKR